MSVRVAEGEIVIKTQGASKNTNRLTKDLSGLSKQSKETGRQLSHSEKEIQRFGLGLVSATSNASALSASLRFAGKAGGVALGFAVLARGTIGFVQQMQDLRLESEKTSKSLSDTFRAGMLSKSSDEAKASAKSIGDQIFDLEQQSQKLDVWKEVRKWVEGAAQSMGVTLDLNTNNLEKAIKEGKEKKALLEIEQKRLKTIERSVSAGNSMSKAMEETFSIEEASVQLQKEKSKYIFTTNEKTKEVTTTLKNSIGLAQKEYDLQLNILDTRERELSEIEKIATQNKDLATLESVRTERNKARVAALNSEQNLIKTIRSEQGKMLAGGGRGGQQALAQAEKKKGMVDKKAAFRTEEEAVLARQKAENAKPGMQNKPLSMADVRRRMAEEAVGLRTPEIQKAGVGTAGGTPNGGGGAGGFRTQISPIPTNASGLPSAGGASVPSESGSGSKDLTDKLIKTVQSLVDTMKSGTVV
jgi:hypothetical protein